MTAIRKKPGLRLPLLLAVGVLAVGLSGCGVEHRVAKPADVTQDELGNGVEPYFWAGPITYQVQVSRQLSPFDSYDVEYLAGVRGAQDLSAQQIWFGVFLWAKNQSGRVATTADKFEITDSAGDVYTPTQLNASVNPYAWRPQRLSPDAIEPGSDSAAGDGSTGGGLILFKLNESAYSNRPLTLKIFAPGHTKASNVSLDL